MGATHPAYTVHWLNLFIRSYIVEIDDCIIWPFSKVKGGYGQIHFNGRMHQVHRLVLTAFSGAATTDKPLALHDPVNCSNPSCINPKHLRWGTHKDNATDRRVENADLTGERNHRAKITEDIVLAIRADTRTYQTIADIYGISKGHVANIKARRVWSHI